VSCRVPRATVRTLKPKT